jgi:hypothetical protein
MLNYDVDYFLQLERAVWRALCEGDMQADSALLADEFLGVYPTGRADKSAHVTQLRDGPTMSTFSLTDAQAVILAEEVVLLTYRAEFVRHCLSSQKELETMFVSSIWRKSGETWRNVFSQDTNAP